MKVIVTDGDFFVTVDPRNWKRLKEEEEVLAYAPSGTYAYF
jgi:hypothetical protein